MESSAPRFSTIRTPGSWTWNAVEIATSFLPGIFGEARTRLISGELMPTVQIRRNLATEFLIDTRRAPRIENGSTITTPSVHTIPGEHLLKADKQNPCLPPMFK